MGTADARDFARIIEVKGYVRKQESGKVLPMYNETYDFLDKIGLHTGNEDEVVKILWESRESNAYRRILAEQVSSAINTNLFFMKEIRQLDGFNLLVNGKPLERRWNKDEGVAVRKMLSFSSVSFIQNGKIVFDRSSPLGGSVPKWHRGVNFFVRFLLKYRSTIERNMIVPFPNIEQKDRSMRHTYRHTSFSGSLLPVDLEYDAVSNQFFESGAEGGARPNAFVTLYLPHVSMLSIDSIVKLREEEKNPFILYQRWLSDFFRKSSEATTEQVLLDCMKEVDSGIRRIDAAFHTLKKKHRYHELSIGLGLTTAILCLIAPPEVAEFVRAAVGGATGVSALQYFSMRGSELDTVKGSDFYFPWLLAGGGKAIGALN